MYKNTWYCRWDGKTYKPVKQTNRDGFCCSACKQALYRAHKKYVTAKPHVPANRYPRRVTPAASTTPRRDGRKTHASSGTTQGRKRKKRK